VSEVRFESSIKADSPLPSLLVVYRLQQSFFKELLSTTMGRKALSRQDRINLAKKRGYFVQSSPDQQNVKTQVEQRTLANATKNKHLEVANIFEEYVRLDIVYGLLIEILGFLP
jgi:hypothetical protein